MFINLVLLSIFPYAISNWLIWQGLKEGTILPCGSYTCKHGAALGWAIKLLYFGTIITIGLNYGFIYFIVVPITWFLGGWVAAMIERKMYEDKVKKIVVEMADFYKTSAYSRDHLIEAVAVPDWWYKLMSNKWKGEYSQIIMNL